MCLYCIYIYTYMYAYIYIIIYIFNIFSMKLEDPHMCFYNPPFLSMAHMGMAPEYQPDDAGFSATWPVCSPHKNELFMVTSCWNYNNAAVIYGIYIKIWYDILWYAYVPMIQIDGSLVYHGQITSIFDLKAGGLMSNHPQATWLLDRLSPHPLPSMVLALSPGSDVMSILDKLGEHLGKSLVNLNLNVCLMQFEAEMSDSPVFMCCAKADGLQACVQSKFLEPCQWYIPGLALENRFNRSAEHLQHLAAARTVSKFHGWKWVIVGASPDLFMGVWTIEHPTQARFRPHFSVDSPYQLWLVLGGLLNCDALSLKRLLLLLFTGYRYIF